MRQGKFVKRGLRREWGSMPRRVWRCLRLGLVVVAATALSACSTLRFAYNHLDTLVHYELSDFVKLDTAQRKQFDAAFAAGWDWHRRTQLPAYAETLQVFADDALQPRTLDIVRAEDQRLEAHQRVLFTALVERFAPLAAGLSDAQVQGLLDKLTRENDKTERELRAQTAAARLQARAQEAEARLRKTTGDLSVAQRQRIAAWAAAQTDDTEPRMLALFPAWRRELAALLATRAQADFAARLQAFVNDPQAPEFAAAQPLIDADTERSLQLRADLSTLLDARQRQHLHDYLVKYQQDCVALAAQAPKTATAVAALLPALPLLR